MWMKPARLEPIPESQKLLARRLHRTSNFELRSLELCRIPTFKTGNPQSERIVLAIYLLLHPTRLNKSTAALRTRLGLVVLSKISCKIAAVPSCS